VIDRQQHRQQTQRRRDAYDGQQTAASIAKTIPQDQREMTKHRVTSASYKRGLELYIFPISYRARILAFLIFKIKTLLQDCNKFQKHAVACDRSELAW
jgi:hypothetical protein